MELLEKTLSEVVQSTDLSFRYAKMMVRTYKLMANQRVHHKTGLYLLKLYNREMMI